MPETAGTGPDVSLEPRSQCRTPLWVPGTQLHELSTAASDKVRYHGAEIWSRTGTRNQEH